jgi:hypothetical protein
LMSSLSQLFPQQSYGFVDSSASLAVRRNASAFWWPVKRSRAVCSYDVMLSVNERGGVDCRSHMVVTSTAPAHWKRFSFTHILN